MSNKKYFAVDVSNDPHITELYETVEEAKKSCLDGAISAYEFAGDMDDCENYENYDLPYAVYGVVLGRAKSNTRPLTDEETESGDYEGIDYIVESPELTEVNGWIKCKDRLPDLHGRIFSRVCLVYGFEDEDDHEETVFTALMERNGEWHGLHGKCFKVTHWQPFPAPPID